MNESSLRINDLAVKVAKALPGLPTLLFVHGGPGGHAGYFEEGLRTLPGLASGIGWVTYDQRGCGRSGGGELSHETNIEDVFAIVRSLKAEGIELDGIVGHSYGAWLAYDCVRREKSLFKRLVMIGLGPDFREPRTRSLIMDLIALKLQQPEAYQALYHELQSHAESPWKISKRVRDVLQTTDLRKLFYWGNLEAMRWYDQVKRTVQIQESDEVYRSVRASLYENEEMVSGPHLDRIEAPTLWINGVQDFLMSGLGQAFGHVQVEHFMGSGHYPHFEEPEKFVRILESFIGSQR